MLVLMRKIGETIRLSDGAEIKILRIRGSQISVGVRAPQEITILRGELDRRPRPGKATIKYA